MAGQGSILRKRREFALDSTTNGLLYLQLETELKQRILDGHYAVGERIPTEPELCRSSGMSRITVRRAVQDLVEEGLLRKVQGRGTFVAIPKHVLGMHEPESRGFGSEHGLDGIAHRQVLEKGAEHADAELARLLGIDEGAQVYFVRRLICEEDFPMAIDNLFVSAELFPGLLDLMADEVSFYGLVDEHYGYEFGMEDLTLDVSMARGDEGELLQCPGGSSLFILKKCMERPDGIPLHYSKSIVRGDRVTYHFQVDKKGRVVNRGKEFSLTVGD